VGRASAFVAAGASLLLSLGFYSVQNVLQDLGARGELISPALGVWLPFILFGAVALILFETMPT
jgi:lipopolysaccharide export LptBFGC system permease protein LptF